jgi:hypothetical protein
MKIDGKIGILAISLSLILSSGGMAQSPRDVDTLDDVLLLIQSELDYLEAGDRRISVEIREASPDDALKEIGRKAQLTIRVKGSLPKTPRLTATFRDATVKEVLKWFAKKVGVVYRVDPGDELLVFPAPEPGKP